MTDYSISIKNKLLGDKGDIMKECLKKYNSGDRTAIMTVLIFCSFHQTTIPDWVADELLTLDDKISNNQVKDMNEFFDFSPMHKGKLGAIRNIQRNSGRVLRALFNHRINGGSLNSESGLRPLAQKLGLPSRIVESIYKKDKSIKNLPTNRNSNHGLMTGELPPLLDLAKINREKNNK